MDSVLHRTGTILCLVLLLWGGLSWGQERRFIGNDRSDEQGNIGSASTLPVTTTGVANTGYGVGPLYSNTTGHHNTATGNSTLLSNTTGAYNTASGTGALLSNTEGMYNSERRRRAPA